MQQQIPDVDACSADRERAIAMHRCNLSPLMSGLRERVLQVTALAREGSERRSAEG